MRNNLENSIEVTEVDILRYMDMLEAASRKLQEDFLELEYTEALLGLSDESTKH